MPYQGNQLPSSTDSINQMQTGTVIRLCEFLTEAGWSVAVEASPNNLDFLAQFDFARLFASRVRSCVSPDEKVWFQGWEDFSDGSENGWRFIELAISLASAAGDAKWESEVRDFWARHVPIALSVRSGYQALLLDLQGRVLLVIEPQFESPILLANRVEEFLEQLSDANSDARYFLER